MKNIRIKEELIKITMKLEEIQEDVKAIRDLERRIEILEKDKAFLKGFTTFAVTVVIGIVTVVYQLVSKVGL